MNSSRRERVITTIVASILAIIPVWLFATQLQKLLNPNSQEIAEDRQRRRDIVAAHRNDPRAPVAEDGAILGGVPADPAATPHPVRDFPEAGSVDHEDGDYSRGSASVELVDATQNGLDKVVRFRSIDTGATIATVYVPHGRTSNFQVPAGGYRVTMAEGSLWYGRRTQFGVDGRYYAPQMLVLPADASVGISLPGAAEAAEAVAMTTEGEF